MRSLSELAEEQNVIIKLQSDVINELFLLLMQHITAEEADALPMVAQINSAAEMRREIGLVDGTDA